MPLNYLLSKFSSLKFRHQPRERLVRNYFFIFVFLVAGGLITSGLLEIYFRYYETQEQIFHLQSETARSAINRIAQFILEIEGQMKSASLGLRLANQDRGAANQFELKTLLYGAPAITDVVLLDEMGAVQLRASKLRAATPVEDRDYSKDRVYLQAKQGVTYYGSVYFRRRLDPYITIGVPVESYPGNVVGVLEAEVSLRFIWDIVRALHVTKSGYGYIVTRSGDVIAHPNLSFVLRRRKAGQLAQVQAALRPVPDIPTPQSMVARSLTGEKVLSSYAYLPSLDWAVIVERPFSEAYKGLYASLLRTSTLLLIGFGVALLAAAYVGRRIVHPLQQLSRGADRIAGGDWGVRLDIRTGDEIETLANRFNAMVNELMKSYQTLEDKVEKRTKELSALFDITAASTRSLDISTVSDEVVRKIAEIFAFDSTRIYLINRPSNCFHLVASFGVHPSGLIPPPYARDRGLLSEVRRTRKSVIFEDIKKDARYEDISYSYGSAKAGYDFLSGFPINTKEECLGVITMMGKSPRRLAPADIRLITAMTDQIGIAVENINLFEQVKARTAEQETANHYLRDSLEQQTTVAEILRVMAQSPRNLESLLNSIVEGAVRLANAKAGVIRLCGSQGLPFAAHYRNGGSQLEELKKLILPTDEDSATTRAVRECKPFQIADIKNVGSDFRVPVQNTTARTVLAVPMLGEDTTIGAIVIYRDIVEPFTEPQIELVKTFADQAVIAIENVKLFEHLVSRTNVLSTLYDFTAGANRSLELSNVLQDVVNKFATTFRFDSARLFLLGPEGKNILLKLTAGSNGEMGEPRSIPLGAGIMGRVAESGTPFIFNDIQTDSLYETLSLTKGNKKNGYRFEGFFPIKSKGKPLGVVVCVNRQARTLSDDELQLIQSVLDPIGVAIENMQLFEEIQNKSQALEDANKQLVLASDHKSRFLADVSHELRTPLTVLKGAVDNMLDGLTGEFNERQGRYLTRLRMNIDRLNKLISDLLDLSRIEAGVVEFRPTYFGIVQLIREVSENLKPIAEKKQVIVELRVPDRELTVWGDRSRVSQVLINLLDNAFRFTPDSSTVTISAKSNGFASVEISVNDQGPGITAEDGDKIFDKFYRVEGVNGAHHVGVGLGLNIAQNLVKLHGGKIWVDSEMGKGSSFFFTLSTVPLSQARSSVPV